MLNKNNAFATGSYSHSENNNETLEDLISSIEGIESVTIVSDFEHITMIVNRCSLSDKELQRLWNYADNNKNIVISFK